MAVFVLSAQGIQSCSVPGGKLLEHHQGLLGGCPYGIPARKVSGVRRGCCLGFEAHQQGLQAVAGPSYSLIQELCSLNVGAVPQLPIHSLCGGPGKSRICRCSWVIGA